MNEKKTSRIIQKNMFIQKLKKKNDSKNEIVVMRLDSSQTNKLLYLTFFSLSCKASHSKKPALTIEIMEEREYNLFIF